MVTRGPQRCGDTRGVHARRVPRPDAPASGCRVLDAPAPLLSTGRGKGEERRRTVQDTPSRRGTVGTRDPLLGRGGQCGRGGQGGHGGRSGMRQDGASTTSIGSTMSTVSAGSRRGRGGGAYKVLRVRGLRGGPGACIAWGQGLEWGLTPEVPGGREGRLRPWALAPGSIVVGSRALGSLGPVGVLGDESRTAVPSAGLDDDDEDDDEDEKRVRHEGRGAGCGRCDSSTNR